MQGDVEHSEDHNRTAISPRGVACLAAALVAVGVFLPGCGGGSPTSGVAHLGSSTQATSSTAAASSRGSGSSASPGSQAVAYSACVRAHGVPNFPDPKVSTHGNEVRVAIGINPAISGNPNFKSAQQACRKLLPNGGPGGGEGNHQITPQEQSQYLKAAACIRSHGVPNLPDPTFSGGGVHIEHHGLNESSPAFKVAVHACESLIPGGVHGGSGSTPAAAP
jgi:hypothetical protein